MINRIDDTLSCRMIFFIVAFYTGLWTIRIPDIKDQISTNYLGIGYIFFSFALGSIMLMLMANVIIKKYSSKKVIEISGYGQGITWLIMPFVNDLYVFLILAFIVGCTYGIFEVSMNLQASNIEKQRKKSMMSGFHAFFSLGLLIGSLFTSFMVEMNITLFTNVIIVVIILLPMTIIFSRFLQEDTDESTKNNKKSIFFLWPLLIFILVLITITDSFTEGAVDEQIRHAITKMSHIHFTTAEDNSEKIILMFRMSILQQVYRYLVSFFAYFLMLIQNPLRLQ